MICNRCRSREGYMRYLNTGDIALCDKCMNRHLENGLVSKGLRMCWIEYTFGPLERYTPLTEVGLELNEPQMMIWVLKPAYWDCPHAYEVLCRVSERFRQWQLQYTCCNCVRAMGGAK